MSDSKWITFRLSVRQAPKTQRWDVLTKGGEKEVAGVKLGVVQWWAAWRRYAFFPEAGTLFEPTCLRDIATFCEKWTTEHKETLRQRGELARQRLRRMEEADDE